MVEEEAAHGLPVTQHLTMLPQAVHEIVAVVVNLNLTEEANQLHQLQLTVAGLLLP